MQGVSWGSDLVVNTGMLPGMCTTVQKENNPPLPTPQRGCKPDMGDGAHSSQGGPRTSPHGEGDVLVVPSRRITGALVGPTHKCALGLTSVCVVSFTPPETPPRPAGTAPDRNCPGCCGCVGSQTWEPVDASGLVRPVARELVGHDCCWLAVGWSLWPCPVWSPAEPTDWLPEASWPACQGACASSDLWGSPQWILAL